MGSKLKACALDLVNRVVMWNARRVFRANARKQIRGLFERMIPGAGRKVPDFGKSRKR
jgi:hypothetical protein